jgi:hypothetical protein
LATLGQLFEQTSTPKGVAAVVTAMKELLMCPEEIIFSIPFNLDRFNFTLDATPSELMARYRYPGLPKLNPGL